jgi:hypothetical protein
VLKRAYDYDQLSIFQEQEEGIVRGNWSALIDTHQLVASYNNYFVVLLQVLLVKDDQL